MKNRRVWRIGGLGVLAVLIGFLAWHWSGWRATAQVGAAYGARMTCSCRYVEGRSGKSCKGDTEPGMWIVHLSDDPQQKAVTGSVPLMASRTARLTPGFGCVLDPAK